MSEGEPVKLREKAIEAYEKSLLREEDQKRNQTLIGEITRFLHRIGHSVYVNSNPFVLDDLTFYASQLEDLDGVFGYELRVSRQCSTCKENILLQIDDTVGLAHFGQWLLEPHLCEFNREARKPVKGFGR